MTYRFWLEVLFWVAALLLLYIYVGYPALCWILARLRPRPWRGSPSFRPCVSVVIAAYNEAEHIRDRILNAADQETAFEFEILVGSDGSTDATHAIAQAAIEEAARFGVNVRVFDFPRAGKLSTLVRLLEYARGDVIVFTDANSHFAIGALAEVVAPLADPTIGCVAGVKSIGGGNFQTAGGETSYWSFENRLKQWESTFGSCAGADGSLYAVRLRDIAGVVTDRLLADDFAISLAACGGKRRCVLAPNAIAIERSDTSSANELRRKARILAGALPAIVQNRRLLLPGSGLSLVLWSHKVLRWFSFVPICGMLVGALGLPPGLRDFFYLGVGSAASTILAGAFFPESLRSNVVKIPYYFALMNFGQVLGLVEWVRRGNEPTWEKVR